MVTTIELSQRDISVWRGDAKAENGIGCAMIPNFVIIIGAMKSGTTTLYDHLKRHPKIATGWNKEPGFFAFEEKWALGHQWYESQFDFDERVHTYALDATTDYSKHPFCKDIVARLKASSPRRFKLIYIMRHPLRRIESHARHAERTGHEVGQFPSPRHTHSLDSGISPVAIAASRYAHQIDQYSEYYERGDLLLLTLESFAKEPKATITSVCKFLDISPLPLQNISLKSNVAEEHNAAPVWRRLYPTWQSLKQVTPLQMLATLTPNFMRAGLSSTLKAWSGPQGRFHLNAAESKAIVGDLAPDLRRLKDRYGIDPLKEWGIVV